MKPWRNVSLTVKIAAMEYWIMLMKMMTTRRIRMNQVRNAIMALLISIRLRKAWMTPMAYPMSLIML